MLRYYINLGLVRFLRICLYFLRPHHCISECTNNSQSELSYSYSYSSMGLSSFFLREGVKESLPSSHDKPHNFFSFLISLCKNMEGTTYSVEHARYLERWSLGDISHFQESSFVTAHSILPPWRSLFTTSSTHCSFHCLIHIFPEPSFPTPRYILSEVQVYIPSIKYNICMYL